MPPARARRKPRAETRVEILDAAARVFARRGFHGASVEAVSEEAGFSTGALYSNFAGKEDLFLSLYEERIQRRRGELRDAVAGVSGGRAGLASAAASVDEVLGREREWFLLYFEFALHAARNPDFARRFEAVREEGLRELTEGLAEALRRADARSTVDPAVLASAIRALTYGVALDRLVADEPAPAVGFERLLALLFQGLRPQAGP